MVIIFDLDDTLYAEIDYVISGFRAVSFFLSETVYSGRRSDHIFEFLISDLEANGRGKNFDNLIAHLGLSKSFVQICLRVYRLHFPKISLSSSVEKTLKNLSSQYPLYLITDGNLTVQRLKIKSLRLNQYMKKCIPTRQLGLQHEKPSLKAFEFVKHKESCEWKRMVYIGDNPRKDFYGLNQVGGWTIQVLQGPYALEPVPHNYQPQFKIESILEIPQVIRLCCS